MEIALLAVTVVSLVLAFVMGAAARRVAREERARSGARVAALAAAAHTFDDGRDELPAPGTARASARTTDASTPSNALGDAFLHTAVAPPASGGRQRGLAIAAAVLFIATIVGGYFAIYDADSLAATGAPTASTATPLELISLRHERQNSGLAITGLVRNPVGAMPVEKLAAVVFLFDPQGNFLTSSRAAVDYTHLAAGDESPFVIRIEAPANVARYRVSFRTDTGVLPHVDRRGQEPIARELP